MHTPHDKYIILALACGATGLLNQSPRGLTLMLGRQLESGRDATLHCSRRLPPCEWEIKKVVNQKFISIQLLAQSTPVPCLRYTLRQAM